MGYLPRPVSRSPYGLRRLNPKISAANLRLVNASQKDYHTKAHHGVPGVPQRLVEVWLCALLDRIAGRFSTEIARACGRSRARQPDTTRSRFKARALLHPKKSPLEADNNNCFTIRRFSHRDLNVERV